MTTVRKATIACPHCKKSFTVRDITADLDKAWMSIDQAFLKLETSIGSFWERVDKSVSKLYENADKFRK